MAANLAGMFQQLNNAIQQRPTGEALLGQASRGLGGMLAGQLGGDRMSYMNPGAKVLEGKEQMAGVDMTTAKGLAQAAQIYQRMGEPEKALEIAQAARQLREQQAAQWDAAQTEIQQAGAETNLHRQATQQARANGDKDALAMLQSGIMKPSEYLKMTLATNQKAREAQASRDPLQGSFTDTIKDPATGKEMRVRFNSAGTPIALLGEKAADYALTEKVNPATGLMETAAVNKKNPQDQMFLGQSEIDEPEISIQKNSAIDGRYDVFEDGKLVRTFDSIDEAQDFNTKMQVVAKAGSTRNSIHEARKIINAHKDDWGPNRAGGLAGALASAIPGTDAWDLKTYLNSIRANLGFDQLRELREAGGTLGQVSNIENILLQSTIDQLDQYASEGRLEQGLAKVEKHLINMQKMALGESVTQTIDWTAPEYQNMGVQVAVDTDGKQVVRLPDGTLIK